MAIVRGMHQTTIRFGHELWEKLEVEAEHAGISAAQYVREAAIERLARSGALGDPGGAAGTRAAEAARDSEFVLEESRALAAQNRLARSRARKLRAAAEVAREK